MTHPLLRKDIFVETAFEKRFQARLCSAWHKRSWHVIVADPGASKTMGIRDLLKTIGGRSVLAMVAPKNNEDEQDLGDQLYMAPDLPLRRGHWRTRKPKLMGRLYHYGTECLVVDDAHDLSLEHLMLLKEVTDQGRLQYDHPLGLCLVATGRGNTIPLKETLDLETAGTVGEQVQTGKTPKCTFFGVVSIALQRFLDSGVTQGECPNCARTRSLAPSKGLLRFPSHDKRKTNAPVTGVRWAMRETIWEVVGGESK